ncbi:MAG: hypothetical protein KDK75_03890 [Alphaproteobacteria bacterium]|nr:hypothetical protein [Alphaproteobacteria bacterium]
MSRIIRLALTSLAVTRIKSSAERAATYAALLAVTAVILVTALGFCLSALWIWLTQLYGPLIASGSIGAALLIMSVGLYLYAGSVRRRPVRNSALQLPQIDNASLQVSSSANVLAGAVVVAGVGYIAGRLLARK